METKHSGAVLSDGLFRAEIRSLTSSTIHARFLSTALEHSRLCGADASPPPSQPWRCVTWEHAIDLWKSPGANGSSFRRITVCTHCPPHRPFLLSEAYRSNTTGVGAQNRRF